MPVPNCKKPPPPPSPTPPTPPLINKEQPILAIVLGIIYGIMILSVLLLIFQNKLIKCPTC
jgi:hypothetical protein